MEKSMMQTLFRRRKPTSHYSSSEIMGVLLDVQSTLKSMIERQASQGGSKLVNKEEDDPKYMVNEIQ